MKDNGKQKLSLPIVNIHEMINRKLIYRAKGDVAWRIGERQISRRRLPPLIPKMKKRGTERTADPVRQLLGIRNRLKQDTHFSLT